jgi:NAD(P)-dependent dehydrogenase (short-subunit alcohol dehydrogenase family)
MSKLAEKVALVTGGSRGIGAAIAKRLATDGASVAITFAKDTTAASAVAPTLKGVTTVQAGSNAIPLPTVGWTAVCQERCRGGFLNRPVRSSRIVQAAMPAG